MDEIELLRNFRRNANGSWSPLRQVRVGGVSMGPGASFTRNASFSGVNVAELLDAAAAKYPHLVQT